MQLTPCFSCLDGNKWSVADRARAREATGDNRWRMPLLISSFSSSTIPLPTSMCPDARNQRPSQAPPSVGHRRRAHPCRISIAKRLPIDRLMDLARSATPAWSAIDLVSVLSPPMLAATTSPHGCICPHRPKVPLPGSALYLCSQHHLGGKFMQQRSCCGTATSNEDSASARRDRRCYNFCNKSLVAEN